MKRISILLTFLLLALTLAACGSGKQETASSQPPKNTVTLSATPAAGVELEQSHLQAALDYIETLLKASGRTDYTAGINYHDGEIVLKFENDVSDDEINALTALPKLTFRNQSGETVMDGSSVKEAAPGYDKTTSAYVVNLTLTDEGAVTFGEITETYIDQQLSVYLDDQMLSNPTIYAPIYDGAVMIMGDFNADSATDLANKINAAILPLTLARKTG